MTEKTGSMPEAIEDSPDKQYAIISKRSFTYFVYTDGYLLLELL